MDSKTTSKIVKGAQQKTTSKIQKGSSASGSRSKSQSTVASLDNSNKNVGKCTAVKKSGIINPETLSKAVNADKTKCKNVDSIQSGDRKEFKEVTSKVQNSNLNNISRQTEATSLKLRRIISPQPVQRINDKTGNSALAQAQASATGTKSPGAQNAIKAQSRSSTPSSVASVETKTSLCERSSGEHKRGPRRLGTSNINSTAHENPKSAVKLNQARQSGKSETRAKSAVKAVSSVTKTTSTKDTKAVNDSVLIRKASRSSTPCSVTSSNTESISSSTSSGDGQKYCTNTKSKKQTQLNSLGYNKDKNSLSTELIKSTDQITNMKSKIPPKLNDAKNLSTTFRQLPSNLIESKQVLPDNRRISSCKTVQSVRTKGTGGIILDSELDKESHVQISKLSASEEINNGYTDIRPTDSSEAKRQTLAAASKRKISSDKSNGKSKLIAQNGNTVSRMKSPKFSNNKPCIVKKDSALPKLLSNKSQNIQPEIQLSRAKKENSDTGSFNMEMKSTRFVQTSSVMNNTEDGCCKGLTFTNDSQNLKHSETNNDSDKVTEEIDLKTSLRPELRKPKPLVSPSSRQPDFKTSIIIPQDHSKSLTTKSKITQAAKSVTDRLSKVPKSKMSANGGNIDSSVQLMSSTAKQNQIYSSTQQKRNKVKSDKNKVISTHLAGTNKDVGCSILSNTSIIPVENTKKCINSIAGGIKDSAANKRAGNITNTMQARFHRITSEPLHVSQKQQEKCSFENDKLTDEKCTTPGEETCISCLKHLEHGCASELQSGVKTSNLSTEMSNMSDLGNALLTENDALPCLDTICVSDGCFEKCHSMQIINVNDGRTVCNSNELYDSDKVLTRRINFCETYLSQACDHLENKCEILRERIYLNSNNNSSFGAVHKSVHELLDDGLKNTEICDNNKEEIMICSFKNESPRDRLSVTSWLASQDNLRKTESEESSLGDDKDLTQPIVCSNEDCEIRGSDTNASLKQKHKQFTESKDCRGSLLTNYLPAYTIPASLQLISDANLMHPEQFQIKNNFLQINNKCILSPSNGISCKCSPDKCSCTAERGENEISISKSDKDLAGNRLSVTCVEECSDDFFSSNSITWKFENTEHFEDTFEMNGIISAEENLTSDNKMENKKSDDLFCDNISNAICIPRSTDMAQFCNKNDKKQDIKPSQRGESIKWEGCDEEITHHEADAFQQMLGSGLDQGYFISCASDISESELHNVAMGEHFSENILDVNYAQMEEECCVQSSIPEYASQVSVMNIDFETQEIIKTSVTDNVLESICDKNSLESFINPVCISSETLDVRRSDDRNIMLDQFQYQSNLQSQDIMIDACVKDSTEGYAGSESHVSSVKAINKDIIESYLCLPSEVCTELGLPLHDQVLVKECLESCETQVMCQIYDLLHARENNQAQVGKELNNTYNFSDTPAVQTTSCSTINCEADDISSCNSDSITRYGFRKKDGSFIRSCSLPCLLHTHSTSTSKRSNSVDTIMLEFSSSSTFNSSSILRGENVLDTNKCLYECVSRNGEQISSDLQSAPLYCPSLKELCTAFLGNNPAITLMGSGVRPVTFKTTENTSLKYNYGYSKGLDISSETNEKQLPITDSCSCSHSSVTAIPLNENGLNISERKSCIPGKSCALGEEHLLPINLNKICGSDVHLQPCSETAENTQILSHSEYQINSNYCFSEIPDLPDNSDRCSYNYSQVGCIIESAQNTRNSSVQVANYENGELITEVRLDDKSCLHRNEQNVDFSQGRTHETESFETPMTTSFSCIQKDENKESGYFSTNQSQESILIYENEEMKNFADSLRDGLYTSFSHRMSPDHSPSFQTGTVQNNCEVKSCQNESSSQTQNVNSSLSTYGDDLSDTHDTTFSAKPITRANFSDNEIQMNNNSNYSDICRNCLWLLNQKERTETSIHERDKNYVFPTANHMISSENLSGDSLHQEQAVCGQNNQIKVDKSTVDLKETLTFRDEKYSSSYAHRNRCRECSADLHKSEKNNTNVQFIKQKNLLNSSGGLCIDQPYGDHMFELSSENIITEEIICSEAFLRTSNECCSSSQRISDENSSIERRSDLISEENFESKQKQNTAETRLSKQYDKEYSQQNSHLKNSAITISNGGNCDTCFSSNPDLPENNIFFSDAENVENYLANSIITGSCETSSYNASDFYSEGKSQACYGSSETYKPNKCDIVQSNLSRGKHIKKKAFLPGDSANYQENSNLIREGNKCDKFVSDVELVNEAGIHTKNISNSTDLSSAPTLCSSELQASVESAKNLTNFIAEPDIRSLQDCQFCFDTSVSENLTEQYNKQNPSHVDSPDNELFCTEECKSLLLPTTNVQSSILSQGGESLCDVIFDDDVYLSETCDNFVDAEDSLYDSDIENESKDECTCLNPNRNSILYTGSDVSTSLDSFKDAIESFDDNDDDDEAPFSCRLSLTGDHKFEIQQKDTDFSYNTDCPHTDRCVNCQSKSCFGLEEKRTFPSLKLLASKSVLLSDKIRDDLYDEIQETYLNLLPFDNMEIRSKQNSQTKSTHSSGSIAKSFEKSENTCRTDNTYLQFAISSNTDNSPQKYASKCRSQDSLCESNLRINENKLGSSKQLEGSSSQQNQMSDTGSLSAAGISSNIPCKYSDMSVAKDSKDTLSDQPGVKSNYPERNRILVTKNRARTKYEEIMNEKQKGPNKGVNVNLRQRSNNRVLNSITILESKVTAEKQTSSLTAIGNKIETAVTIRNEKRRLRQGHKQSANASSDSSVSKDVFLPNYREEISSQPSEVVVGDLRKVQFYGDKQTKNNTFSTYEITLDSRSDDKQTQEASLEQYHSSKNAEHFSHAVSQKYLMKNTEYKASIEIDIRENSSGDPERFSRVNNQKVLQGEHQLRIQPKNCKSANFKPDLKTVSQYEYSSTDPQGSTDINANTCLDTRSSSASQNDICIPSNNDTHESIHTHTCQTFLIESQLCSTVDILDESEMDSFSVPGLDKCETLERGCLNSIATETHNDSGSSGHEQVQSCVRKSNDTANSATSVIGSCEFSRTIDSHDLLIGDNLENKEAASKVLAESKHELPENSLQVMSGKDDDKRSDNEDNGSQLTATTGFQMLLSVADTDESSGDISQISTDTDAREISNIKKEETLQIIDAHASADLQCQFSTNDTHESSGSVNQILPVSDSYKSLECRISSLCDDHVKSGVPDQIRTSIDTRDCANVPLQISPPSYDTREISATANANKTNAISSKETPYSSQLLNSDISEIKDRTVNAIDTREEYSQPGLTISTVKDICISIISKNKEVSVTDACECQESVSQPLTLPDVRTVAKSFNHSLSRISSHGCTEKTSDLLLTETVEFCQNECKTFAPIDSSENSESDGHLTNCDVSIMSRTDLRDSSSLDFTDSPEDVQKMPANTTCLDSTFKHEVLNIENFDFPNSECENASISNVSSIETCQSAKNVESEILSVKINQNKELIQGISENMSVISSQNQDSDLCSQAHSVCRDNAGESLQLNENCLSNSEHRLSNKTHREQHYDLNRLDVNVDSEIFRCDEKRHDNVAIKNGNLLNQGHISRSTKSSVLFSSQNKLDESPRSENGDYESLFIVDIVDSNIENLTQSEENNALHVQMQMGSDSELSENEDLFISETKGYTDRNLECNNLKQNYQGMSDVVVTVDLDACLGTTKERPFEFNATVTNTGYGQFEGSETDKNTCELKNSEVGIDRCFSNSGSNGTSGKEDSNTYKEDDNVLYHISHCPDTVNISKSMTNDLNTQNVAINDGKVIQDLVSEEENENNMRQSGGLGDLSAVNTSNGDAEICEDSNISVALALRREKENITEEKMLPSAIKMNNRSFRRATTAVILQNREKKSQNQTDLSVIEAGADTRNKVVRKSKSFQFDRLSEYKTLEGFPAVNNNEQINDLGDNIINKKVSDICKAFIEKTQTCIAEKQSLQKLSPVVSPLPQRKLMNWVCKEGKWKREPIHEQTDIDQSKKGLASTASSLVKDENENYGDPSKKALQEHLIYRISINGNICNNAEDKRPIPKINFCAKSSDGSQGNSEYISGNKKEANSAQKDYSDFTYANIHKDDNLHSKVNSPDVKQNANCEPCNTEKSRRDRNTDELLFMDEDIEYMDGVNPAEIDAASSYGGINGIGTEIIPRKENEVTSTFTKEEDIEIEPVSNQQERTEFDSCTKNNELNKAVNVDDNESRIHATAKAFIGTKLIFDKPHEFTQTTESSLITSTASAETKELVQPYSLHEICRKSLLPQTCNDNRVSSPALSKWKSAEQTDFGPIITVPPDSNNELLKAKSVQGNQVSVTFNNISTSESTVCLKDDKVLKNDAVRQLKQEERSERGISSDSLDHGDTNDLTPNQNNFEKKRSEVSPRNNYQEGNSHRFKKKPCVPLPNKRLYGYNQQNKKLSNDGAEKLETVNNSLSVRQNSISISKDINTGIPNTIIDQNEPITIPKLKAVKIKEEEIFEGKPEYTKKCNLNPLGIDNDDHANNQTMLADKPDTTNNSEISGISSESSDFSGKQNVPNKTQLSKLIKKSKTFSALRDMQHSYDKSRKTNIELLTNSKSAYETLNHTVCKIPKRCIDNRTVSEVKNKTDPNNSENNDNARIQPHATYDLSADNTEYRSTRKLTRTISLPDNQLVYGKSTDKRNPAKSNGDSNVSRTVIQSVTKAVDLQKSQIPVGKDNGEKTNERRCERSKSLQRPKLLSEIVEVEESRDDLLQTQNNRGPSTSPSGPALEPRFKRPVVRRTNKRRSLSLPTGTLAFGEARIVYKNGHFTIETMDGTELESSGLTNQQPCYMSNQDQSANQKLSHNRGHPTPARMLPEPHSGLQREITTERPQLRRQIGKAVLNKNELIENGDVFDSNIENVSPNRKHYIKHNMPISSMCSKERGDVSFGSQNNSKQSLSESAENVSFIEQMELDHENESLGEMPVRYHSSSSLPDATSEEVKRVAQRARRTSSFRQAQEQGAYRLSGIEEDKDHDVSRRRTVSLDESQNTDLNQTRISQSSNQNTSFFQRMMAKRKSSTGTENLNLSGFTKQSESAKDFFAKKMSLKGLFRKNRSDSSVNSPLKTQLSASPPVSVFIREEDRNSVGSAPSSPYTSKDMRRRHTSADLFSKAFRDATPSSQPNSSCSTPTRDRGQVLRSNSVTPALESNFIVRTDNISPMSASSSSSISKLSCSITDEDQLSIKSTSSTTSSIHSVQNQPLEQPDKPKTPKPVGTSPRRIPSGSSQSSRIFMYRDRNTTLSVTSLESENSEIVFEDDSDYKCECENLTPTLSRARKQSNTSDTPMLQQRCELCGKYTAEFSEDPGKPRKFTIGPAEQLEDHGRLQKGSSGRLALLVQTDISASNSNDSGIQHDVSVHSSSESLKGTPEAKVRLRRQKSSSPRPERPKSEIGVRWADLDTQEYDVVSTPVRRRERSQNIKDRPRPKSDFDGSSFFSDRLKAFGSDANLQPYCSLRNLYEMRRRDWENNQGKNRRMSTPHPIKSRLQCTPKRLVKQAPLVRSSSMPESLDKVHKRRKLHHLLDFHEASLSKHMDIDECLSDDSDLSFDHISLQEKSLSVQSSQSQLTSMDEEEDNLTFAEALWDHITMDPEELGFRAGDLINVFDMSDKDWWFGEIEDREGWFPAAFVRLRVNQDQLEDEELEVTLQAELSTSPKLRRISTINKNQARTNVVNEIISAEREYVKHLKDVVEGYIQHARKRHEMFSEERLALIFGNIENIYTFAQKFLSQLEMCIDVCPHLSEIGDCFLDNEKGFEIYSDYCNNHPSACEELKELYRNAKYRHFFEACRLLQELVEIPLEGFLLTPVQKICKYPLQLAELLKYTPPEHADYIKVKSALYEMRKIATLINERKRKMESIEKIAAWQHTVADWEGEDLLERSSELIFSGDINKINSAGWSQERYFFLFDHQLIYCKKELLKRHVFSYKGRIDLDHCDIIPVQDGKDTQYNVTVKHGWKLHETQRDKWYLLYTKTDTGKDRWLKALADERKRVREDQENDFCVPEHWKQTVLNKVRSQSTLKEKQHSHKPAPDSHLMLQKDLTSVPYATLPRIRRTSSQKHEKNKGWSLFGGKKSKR